MPVENRSIRKLLREYYGKSSQYAKSPKKATAMSKTKPDLTIKTTPKFLKGTSIILEPITPVTSTTPVTATLSQALTERHLADETDLVPYVYVLLNLTIERKNRGFTLVEVLNCFEKAGLNINRCKTRHDTFRHTLRYVGNHHRVYYFKSKTHYFVDDRFAERNSLEYKPYDVKIVGGSLHGMVYLLRKKENRLTSVQKVLGDVYHEDKYVRFEAEKVSRNVHELKGYNVDHETLNLL